MPRWTWPLALLIVCSGALIGYAMVPHYRAPRVADEARLRERALQYYQASRRFDMRAMAQLFSPAYQMAPRSGLSELVGKRELERSKLKGATRTRFEAAANSVTMDKLEFQVEGDWAVSSGTFDFTSQESGTEREVPLEHVVWVKSSGDWWVYQLKPEELVCYGNPPDFARDLLKQGAGSDASWEELTKAQPTS